MKPKENICMIKADLIDEWTSTDITPIPKSLQNSIQRHCPRGDHVPPISYYIYIST